ncbi:glycerophosphoryl diester phosphodiesterase [Bacillus thermophilus]|jgi:glycerophosphoryl diester phosphodiesterase|uniref:Glycerophosphoryl diester phosphodiesterase n=1 Tax=Siminovitchia thermophila TaxID=1245522 RepID=A0ABS2R727_9BACI|nr:glycerophosphodiester phosphodiesterase family protein [Siminovitchia thermophila]MBM7715409.1 glycerophosphoryl diester phosphodiesterase [Siminovitchia thermophila]ONK22583.1 glycerophosphodiester phosphodiesterase [Bacillus sp. VT-16-64]
MIEQLQSKTGINVAAHRGYSAEYPENTLLAFQKAVDLGVDMIEFDLRLSKDNVVVIIHDDTVDRTTNGTGMVNDLTLKELKELDAGEGEKIPTLEEFCESLQPYAELLFNVEIKPCDQAIEVADRTVELLKKYDFLDRCVFTSFDAEVITHLHDKYNVKTQGFPGEKMLHYIPGEDGTISKIWAIGMSMKLLNPELVQSYKAKGKLAWCYCPDDMEQVKYALDCGVTLLTCNDLLPALKYIKK